MGTRIVAAVGAWVTVALLGASAASAATLSFQPTPQTVGSGSFSIDIVVSGLESYSPLPSGPNCDLGDNTCTTQVVSAYDLSVVFDPLYLQPTNVTFGSYLGPIFSILDADWALDFYALNTVNLFQVSTLTDLNLDALQPLISGMRSFTLATLYFNTLAQTPLTTLSFLPTSLLPPHGPGDIKGLNALPLDIADNGTADITIIPEPGTVVLLMSGLAGLAVVRRRRQTAGTGK